MSISTPVSEPREPDFLTKKVKVDVKGRWSAPKSKNRHWTSKLDSLRELNAIYGRAKTAKMIGISPGYVSECLRMGKCTLVTKLAADAVLASKRPTQIAQLPTQSKREVDTLVCVCVPEKQLTAVTAVLDAMDLQYLSMTSQDF